jgi:predicted  nucleic acid-binding Zn-ribbon protein
MSKKKDKKLEALNVEYDSLNEKIRHAREELGYIECNKMRLKRDIKRMMKRQEELTEKRAKLSGCEWACTAPY